MTLWGSISFNLAVFINIIIAFFYPYVEGASTGEAALPVGPLHVTGQVWLTGQTGCPPGRWCVGM